MEKKTDMAKENNNREDKHFSETWFRDGARLGNPTKLPHSVVGKSQESREHIYKEYQKQRNRQFLWQILAITALGVGVAIYLGIRV